MSEATEHATVYEAMAAAWSTQPKVPKNGENNHTGSRYMILEDIIDTLRPHYGKHGLFIAQCGAAFLEDRVGVTTMIYHKTGGSIELGTAYVTTMPKASKNGVQLPPDAHTHGAAYTYASRYGLKMAFGLCDPTDDDANSLVHPEEPDGGGGRPVDTPAASSGDFLLLVQKLTGLTGSESKSLARSACMHLRVSNQSPAEDWEDAMTALREMDDVLEWVKDMDRQAESGEGRQ